MAIIETKTKNYKIINNENGHEKLVELRRIVNNRQNNEDVALLGVLNNIVGFFGDTLGIASAAFGGALSANTTQLEKLEDMFTTILEDFTVGSSSEILGHAIITLEFVCSGDLIWNSKDPVWTYGHAIIG